MKYLLKTPLLLVCFSFVFIVGCVLGSYISNDFTDLYITQLTLIPIRYTLLFVIVSINFLVFNRLNGTAIILRKKTLFDSLISMVKFEVFILILLFVILHLPILFLNINNSLNYLHLMIKIIINGVIISFFLFCLIKLLDIKCKNRAVACGIVLGSLSLVDFLLEHFNWFHIQEPIFDFSYIFILPVVYNNYFFMALALVIVGIVLTAIYILRGIKKDCFLGSVYDEEN